ncbi:MAG: hypothetical protein P8123_01590 [bacterium]
MRKKYRILRNAAFSCVVLCTMALNAGFLSSMPAPLRLLAALATSLFIPGILLCEIIFGKREFGVFEIVPLWTCVSIGMVFGPVLVAGLILHSAFAGVSTAFCGACLLLIAVNTVMASRAPSRLGYPRPESGLSAYILIALLVLSCIWALWLGGVICGDAHNHLAFIRKVKEMPTLRFGRDQFFKELTTNIHGVGLWNSAVALISRLSNMDILDVWSRLPFVIVPITILAFFALARNLFRRDGPAYLSTILYILWNGVFNIDPLSKQVNVFADWSQFHWPSFVTRGIFLPVALLFALKYIWGGKRRDLVLSSIMALIMTMSYLPYFINLILYLAGFFLAALILAHRRRKEIVRLIIALFIITVVCSLYAVPIMRSLLPVINPAYEAHLRMEEFQGYTIFLFEKYPLLNPARLVWPHPIIMLSFLLGFESTTPYVFAKRRSIAPPHMAAHGTVSISSGSGIFHVENGRCRQGKMAC